MKATPSKVIVKHLAVLKSIDLVGRTGSIRQAAERLGLTPSALTRKIQTFELELGSPIFERLPHGMRLNAAGDLLVQHIRSQTADFERLKSAIEELSGVQRGHIKLVCSQAFVDRVLPDEVSRFRNAAPGVTFDIKVRDHALGIAALMSFEADLIVSVSASPAPEMQILLSGRQPLCAIMHRDHPAVGHGPIRLRDCFAHAVAMPDESLAIRPLLDAARARLQQKMDMRLESASIDLLRNYVLLERLISFQLSTGIPLGTTERLHYAPIDDRDIPLVAITLGKLKGRSLPAAVQRFVDQFAHNPIWETNSRS